MLEIQPTFRLRNEMLKSDSGSNEGPSAPVCKIQHHVNAMYCTTPCWDHVVVPFIIFKVVSGFNVQLLVASC